MKKILFFLLFISSAATAQKGGQVKTKHQQATEHASDSILIANLEKIYTELLEYDMANVKFSFEAYLQTDPLLFRKIRHPY